MDWCDVEVVHLPAVKSALAALPDGAAVTRVAELMGVLSNPIRLKILLALCPAGGASRPELCVCDLATVVKASKSLTSHQLRLLRMGGLVRYRRAGKLAFYELAEGPAAAIVALITVLARDEVETTRGRQPRARRQATQGR